MKLQGQKQEGRTTRLEKSKCKFVSERRKEVIQVTTGLVVYSALKEILKESYIIVFSFLSGFMH